MKPHQLAVTLQVAMEKKLNVLIKGTPGIGKTDIVHQAAKASGNDLIVSHPVVSDPVDYKGMPAIIDDPKTGRKLAEFLPFGDLKALIDAEKPTVFFMDDLGQAPPAVQAAAMQLLLARRINHHKVSDHVCFIGATNNKEDKAGVSGILEPVKSRFCAIIKLEVDLEDWVSWAIKSEKIPTELIAFIRYRPNHLNDFKPTADLTNTACPRTVENCAKWMHSGVSLELEYELFSGAAGEGFASELLSFLKIFRKLPNPDRVLMDPENAQVPEDPATLYAICGALSARASEQNMGRIVTYSNRLPDEFSVLMIRDSVKNDPQVADTKAFIEWASGHKDVLI
jgi:hypothetical protein